MSLFYSYMGSPVGDLLLAGDGDCLTQLRFTSGPKAGAVENGWREDRGPFTEVVQQLAAYFAGELTEFDLPLAPRGTAFQMEVWQQLRQIPYGVTISYGELARRINNPAASRAVGLANGANPIGIVIPCHRVIGANGKLTGFGGGMDAKRFLLEWESRQGGLGLLLTGTS